jgi:hypothetical protein
MIQGELSGPRSSSYPEARRAGLLALCLAAAVVGGVVAGSLASANRVLALPALLVVFLPILAWRRWGLTVLGLSFLALLIEQYRIGVPGGDLTDHVPLFTSLSDGFGLSGIYVNPMEILLATVLLVLLVRAGQRRAALPRTALAASLAILVLAVVAGAVHGVASGGDYKMALWESRPLVYVAVMYLLATQLPDSIGVVSGFLWMFVLGVAVKTFQGLYLIIVSLAGGHSLGDYLLSHEDSVFLVLFMVLVVGLWLFSIPGPLRRVSTALLPVVLLVDLANNRRTSWLQLGACLLVLLLVAWIRLPERRKLAAVILITIAVGMAIYLPLYWGHTGLLAQPARAIQSTFAPSARDASSDLYRQVENANLQINIMRSPVIGVGYGIPIDYAIPMVDLSRIDPFIRYIPHNNILYIWMRLGILGALVFWSFIGFAVVSACRLLRARDMRLALYGALVLCAVINYLIMGYLDLGLFWFRVAIFMGLMFGTLEVARRLQAAQEMGPLLTVLDRSPGPAASGERHKVLARTGLPAVEANGRVSRDRTFSRDGSWWWNGARWVRAETEDHLWRWNGASWEPKCEFRGKPVLEVAAELARLAEDHYARGGAVLAGQRAEWQPPVDLQRLLLQVDKVASRLRRIETTLDMTGPESGAQRTEPNSGLERERDVLSGKQRSLLAQVARAAPQPTIREADDEIAVARALQARAEILRTLSSEVEEAERAHAAAVAAAHADVVAAERTRSSAIDRARKRLEAARSVPQISASEMRSRHLAMTLGRNDLRLEMQLDGLRLRSTNVVTPTATLPLRGLISDVGTAAVLWTRHRAVLADLLLLESPEALRFLAALTAGEDLRFLLLVGKTGTVLRPCSPGEEEAAGRFARNLARQAAAIELEREARQEERRKVERELEAIVGRRDAIKAAEDELRVTETDPELAAAIQVARLRLKRVKADKRAVIEARRRLEQALEPVVVAPAPLSVKPH